MIKIFIFISIICVFFIIWIMSTKRRLIILEESIRIAAVQIDSQVSRRFDAISCLVDIIKIYVRTEGKFFQEGILSKKIFNPDEYSVEEIIEQEKKILYLQEKIKIIAEEYPILKTNENYIRAIESMKIIENMVRTSRLIYNDSVHKLNREIRVFPSCLVARILGFTEKDYIEQI